jgi:phospholipid transport system substrate-binding protein
MANDRLSLSRRQFTLTAMAASAAFAVPGVATALTVDDARNLVGKTIDTVNGIINSGKSESGMIKDFEAMFAKYADVPVIARSALGPAARTASAGDISAFTKSFRGYISRKYGRRFREFIGGKIEVTDARPLKSYFEVISVAYLQGEAPFDLRWHVSDKSGKNLFFNLIIEGVNMLASERAEIGALLDQQGGDVGKLAEALKSV